MGLDISIARALGGVADDGVAGDPADEEESAGSLGVGKQHQLFFAPGGF